MPIEELTDIDATAGIGAPTRARRDLHPARAEAHGVVAGDEARVATAQEAVEVARRRAPGWGGVGGRSRKAAREVQVQHLERGNDAPPNETLFSADSLKKALPEVSKTRLHQTVYAEYPTLKEWIQKLGRGP